MQKTKTNQEIVEQVLNSTGNYTGVINHNLNIEYEMEKEEREKRQKEYYDRLEIGNLDYINIFEDSFIPITEDQLMHYTMFERLNDKQQNYDVVSLTKHQEDMKERVLIYLDTIISVSPVEKKRPCRIFSFRTDENFNSLCIDLTMEIKRNRHHTEFHLFDFDFACETEIIAFKNPKLILAMGLLLRKHCRVKNSEPWGADRVIAHIIQPHLKHHSIWRTCSTVFLNEHEFYTETLVSECINSIKDPC